MSRLIDLTGKRFGRLIVDFRSTKIRRSTDAYWICVCDCGNVHTASSNNLRRGKVQSCGCLRKRYGEDNPLWKGGTVKTDEGYIVFRGLNGRRRVAEHRYVMEQHLGRELFPHENVHHRNGVRDDNKLENLELWSVSQPPGQRVEDKINWCLEFLAQYNYTPKISLAQGIAEALSQ